VKFEPEDFLNANGRISDSTAQACADIANVKLKQWLKKAPILYIWDNFKIMHIDAQRRSDDPTHQAKLVCIEEKKIK